MICGILQTQIISRVNVPYGTESRLSIYPGCFSYIYIKDLYIMQTMRLQATPSIHGTARRRTCKCPAVCRILRISNFEVTDLHSDPEAAKGTVFHAWRWHGRDAQLWLKSQRAGFRKNRWVVQWQGGAEVDRKPSKLWLQWIDWEKMKRQAWSCVTALDVSWAWFSVNCP